MYCTFSCQAFIFSLYTHPCPPLFLFLYCKKCWTRKAGNGKVWSMGHKIRKSFDTRSEAWIQLRSADKFFYIWYEKFIIIDKEVFIEKELCSLWVYSPQNSFIHSCCQLTSMNLYCLTSSKVLIATWFFCGVVCVRWTYCSILNKQLSAWPHDW